MTPELKTAWNGVWGIIDKLYTSNRPLTKDEKEWLVYFLNECEEGQKDINVNAYVVMCLQARKRRLERAKGIVLSRSAGATNG